MLAHHNKEILQERILRLIKISRWLLLMLLVRSWYLVAVKGDNYQTATHAPQILQRTVAAARGQIYDRFFQPLAINQIKYCLALDYNAIRHSFSAIKKGKTPHETSYPRREYISRLSAFLAAELDLSYDDIRDQINTKAVFQLPGQYYLLAENLHPELYYRLEGRAHLWPGVSLKVEGQRHYPKESVGGSVIGYIGYLDQHRYYKINREIQELKEYLELTEEELMITPYPVGCQGTEDVRQRLKTLIRQSYCLFDRTAGRSGIELYYDEILRGEYGSEKSRIDARGRKIQDVGIPEGTIAGRTLQLTLSAELQERCEQLLAENETIREGRSRAFDPITGNTVGLKQPWIKGGAIVAMKPNGEVVALASYPRFNPNNFLPLQFYDKQLRSDRLRSVEAVLESPEYIRDVWNLKRPLEREEYTAKEGWSSHKLYMEWGQFLKLVLKEESLVRQFFGKYNGVVSLASFIDELLGREFFRGDEDIGIEGEKELDRGRLKTALQKLLKKTNSQGGKGGLNPGMVEDFLCLSLHEQILLVDLSRLILNQFWIDFALKNAQLLGGVSLDQWRLLHGVSFQIQEYGDQELFEYFQKEIFSRWRQENESRFLKMKRQEEVENEKRAIKEGRGGRGKKNQAVYTLYIQQELNRQYALYREEMLPQLWLKVIKVLKREDGLGRGSEDCSSLNLLAQKVVSGFSPALQMQFAELLSQIQLQWPLFPYQKVLHYDALDDEVNGHYPLLRYTLVSDESHAKKRKRVTLKALAGSFIPAGGFGHMRPHTYRQSTPQGSIFKLIPAYAALLKRYDERMIQGGEPTWDDLNQMLIFYDERYRIPSSRLFMPGYTQDGKALPRSYKGGRIPNSSHGGIGRVDLIQAIATSSNPYFALLASDYMDVQFLNRCAYAFGYGHQTGLDLPQEFSGSLPHDLESNRSGLYAYAIGQHSLTCTPVQTAAMLAAIANHGSIPTPYLLSSIIESNEGIVIEKKSPIYQQVRLPPIIRNLLLEGMYQAVNSPKGTARPSSIMTYQNAPGMIQDYSAIREDFIAKTGTAEIHDMVALDEGNHGTPKVQIYNHIWAAGIAMSRETRGIELGLRDPELIVVVYLRYGDYGKEALPLAAQVVKKWREIQESQME
jgi:cell division protein FtsI/penicillin-binding protein 2